MPLSYVKKRVDRMKTGEEIEILIDDAIAKSAIPNWNRMHGQVIKVEELDCNLRITIRKR